MEALLIGDEDHGPPLATMLERFGVRVRRVEAAEAPRACAEGPVELLVVALGARRAEIERLVAEVHEALRPRCAPFVLVWWPLEQEGGVPELPGVPHDFLLGELEAGRFALRMRIALQRAEDVRRLRRSEEAFRELLRGVPDGVVVCEDRVIRYANEAAARLLEAGGPQELIGRDAAELLFGEEEAVRCRDAALDEPVELRLKGLAGTVRAVEVRRQVVAYEGREATLVLLQDVTARKEAETRRLLTDRMAAVGTLAAGVAHELNNPLAFVTSNLKLLRERLREAPGGMVAVEEIEELVSEALVGLDRMERIVKDMRIFSRADDGEQIGPVDARIVMESALGLCRSELLARATVERRYEDEAPLVAADESRLGQVFLNLVVNALQSIPEGDGENQRVVVGVRRDEEGWVVASVEDTGSGIPTEVLPRIFDPFFSTKEPGEGTGLGLSICRSIVGSFGGEIYVESEVGKGSRFEVRLPPADPAKVRRPVSRRGSSAETLRINRVSSGRTLRVLVVDDEPMMVRTVQRWLRGWEVRSAHGGREALQLLERDHAFDVVLCDVMMPGVDGVEFYERVAERWPALAPRIVFMTGGAFTDRARRFFERVSNERVDKPFDPPQLRELVRLVALGLQG